MPLQALGSFSIQRNIRTTALCATATLCEVRWLVILMYTKSWIFRPNTSSFDILGRFAPHILSKQTECSLEIFITTNSVDLAHKGEKKIKDHLVHPAFLKARLPRQSSQVSVLSCITYFPTTVKVCRNEIMHTRTSFQFNSIHPCDYLLILLGDHQQGPSEEIRLQEYGLKHATRGKNKMLF